MSAFIRGAVRKCRVTIPQLRNLIRLTRREELRIARGRIRRQIPLKHYCCSRNRSISNRNYLKSNFWAVEPHNLHMLLPKLSRMEVQAKAVPINHNRLLKPRISSVWSMKAPWWRRDWGSKPRYCSRQDITLKLRNSQSHRAWDSRIRHRKRTKKTNRHRRNKSHDLTKTSGPWSSNHLKTQLTTRTLLRVSSW